MLYHEEPWNPVWDYKLNCSGDYTEIWYVIKEEKMALACRICIMKNGLRGSEIGSLPQNENELMDHMEKIHHMPIRLKGETEQEAINRFLIKYPEARNCPDCKKAGAPWTS